MALMEDQQAGVNAQADLQRKKAAQQEGGVLQGQKDAMARRAAQLGGGPSGALIKQDQLATDASAQRLQNANEGINAQSDAQMNELRKTQQAQEYGTSERVAGQNFASGERAAGQTFANTQRLGSQDFTAGQNAAGIKAQHDNQVMAINAAAAEGKLSRAEADKQLAENDKQFMLTLGNSQAIDARDFKENHNTNVISTILSGINSKVSPDVMNQLLGSLGIDIGSIPGLTAPETPSPQTTASVQSQNSTVGTTNHYVGDSAGGVAGAKKVLTAKNILHR